MSNPFANQAVKIRKSGFIVPITFVFLAMFVIALVTSYEDYTTSWMGYMALPTHKANLWAAYFVALIPQIGQIGFGYTFIGDSSKRWAGLITLGLFLADVGTDVFFKAHGQPTEVVVMAVFESVVIYTLGSEVMLTTATGMLATLLPDAVKQTLLMLEWIASWLQNKNAPLQQSTRPQQPHRPAPATIPGVNPIVAANRRELLNGNHSSQAN